MDDGYRAYGWDGMEKYRVRGRWLWVVGGYGGYGGACNVTYTVVGKVEDEGFGRRI